MILMIEAAPMRWSATTASPGRHKFRLTAYSRAAARVSSVVSESVAFTEPSASKGMTPLEKKTHNAHSHAHDCVLYSPKKLLSLLLF